MRGNTMKSDDFSKLSDVYGLNLVKVKERS